MTLIIAKPGKIWADRAASSEGMLCSLKTKKIQQCTTTDLGECFWSATGAAVRKNLLQNLLEKNSFNFIEALKEMNEVVKSQRGDESSDSIEGEVVVVTVDNVYKFVSSCTPEAPETFAEDEYCLAGSGTIFAHIYLKDGTKPEKVFSKVNKLIPSSVSEEFVIGEFKNGKGYLRYRD